MARPKQRATEKPARRVRLRSRPLTEIDEAKLATALALMARRLLEQRSADDRDHAPGSGGDSAEDAA